MPKIPESVVAVPRVKYPMEGDKQRGTLHVDNNTGEVVQVRSGSARLDLCERRGAMKLIPKGGTENDAIVVETNCKSWGCTPCSRRLRARFNLVCELGALTLAPCAFITATYKVVRARYEDAGFVKRDWQELRNGSALKSLEWLRVPELTKKKMLHYHILAGKIEGDLRCYGKDFNVFRFKKRFDSCECLSHSVSRSWYTITGDSYICHVVPVIEKTAGNYLSKYMSKTYQDRLWLETLYGLKRRWSTSSNWPGTQRLRLKQSVASGGEGFQRHGFFQRNMLRITPVSEQGPRVGPDLLQELTAMKGLRSAKARVARKTRRY